jgi:hypothetical protein
MTTLHDHNGRWNVIQSMKAGRSSKCLCEKGYGTATYEGKRDVENLSGFSIQNDEEESEKENSE